MRVRWFRVLPRVGTNWQNDRTERQEFMEKASVYRGSKLDDLKGNGGGTAADETDFPGCLEGKVDHAVVFEGTSVVDSDDDRQARSKVQHFHERVEGKCAVGGSESVHVVRFAVGGFPPIELLSIVRCYALELIRFRFCRRGRRLGRSCIKAGRGTRTTFEDGGRENQAADGATTRSGHSYR